MKNPPNFLAYFGISCMVAALLSACGPIGGIVGSGDVITEARQINDFDEIEFNFVGTLMISQGDETSLTIEGDDNIIELIETSVRGSTLIIDTKRNRGVGNILNSSKIAYTIVTPNLEKVHIAGAGDAYMDPFVTDELTIDVSGAGSIEVTQVTAEDVKVDVSGAGSVDLSGSTQSLIVELNGLGSVEAGKLASDVADVGINGAGSAELWVSESLDAKISGAGSISYYGNPSVEQDVSGLGSIDGLGNKE